MPSTSRWLSKLDPSPPYVIFNDRTLSLMSSFKPTDERELLAVKGVGEKKAADLGATFLAAIAAHEA